MKSQGLSLKLILASLLLASVWYAPCARPQGTEESGLVIQGGTVIDVRTGKLMPPSVVVIRGDRIEAVGPAGQTTVPAGAQIIKAEGKYVLPGLWDTHAHTRDFDGALNIHHGVTSTMDMGNILDWILTLSEAREKQQAFGPRIFPEGMSIGGLLGQHQWAARTVEQARWAAQRNIEAGVYFLKVYQDATPDMVKAVAEEAHQAGLNLHGHLRDTDARQAVLAGINAVAHGSGVAAATSPPAAAERTRNGDLTREIGQTAPSASYLQDPAMFHDLIKLMVERNVLLEPNIVQLYRGVYDQWDQYQLENHRFAVNPNLHYIPEMFTRMWATDFNFRPYPPPPDLLAKLKKGLANHQLFARKFAAAGGKFLVGTDNYYHAIAGLAVWQEMELMADAGIPPLAILQGATINPAQFVHQDKNLGTVEAGKLADLIVVGKNPLENMKNIRTLETVIQHGKVQDRTLRSDYRVVIPRPWQTVNNELPRPYISSVQPSAVPAGTKQLTLTIKGRDFDRRHRVLWERTDLRVVSLTPAEVKVLVPDDLLRRAGTYKVHMITGGRVHQPGLNFGEVMVTFGRKFDQRWNGQKLSIEF